MKKSIFLSKMLYIALFIGFTCLSKLYATDYTISFTASGAATTISSVEVQNLTQSTNVIVPGGAPVNLTNTTVIPQLKYDDNKLNVYPNPVTDKANISFYSEFGGKTDIVVFGIDGKSVMRYSKNLPIGINEFKLTLPKGFYGLHINQNGIVHYATVISQTNDEARIEFTDSEISSSNAIKKIGYSAITLTYKIGDNILLKGYSGDLCTIVTIKPPTKDTTVNFNFVECRDADGYNYPVVLIGTQIWMAENLKTTKYRNGDAIGTTTGLIPNDATSKYQWAFEGNETNAAKYGRLYTWYAATDSRDIAPAGWHLPADTEWTTLENYLIANGYNYDGTTTGNKIAKSLAATTDWLSSINTGATGNDLTKNNRSGFTALPGGYRDTWGTFYFIGNYVGWWTSTESDSKIPWYRTTSQASFHLYRSDYTKRAGFSIRCVRDDIINNVLPTLTTTVISSDIWDFAVCGGNITNDGGSTITARGVCWSLKPNPTTNDSISMSGNGIGSFTCVAKNLMADTTYYLRAFATNPAGTAYGNTVTFRTLNPDLLRGCIEAYPNQTGVKDSAYLNGKLVYCTKINDKYIYQGDIILEDPATMKSARRKAAGINNLSKRWPFNTVYYTINSNFKNPERIYNAIKEYHDKTNLKFVETKIATNYIEFIYDEEGCFSTALGMDGNRQLIAIADWGNTKSVIHEIGHAIGLLHEQSKAGRDDFVTIIWDNIDINKKHNFDEDKNSINTPGFDFKSIMLYDSWGFSKFSSHRDATTATILKKDGTTFYTFDNNHLSETDITLINTLYPVVNIETVNIPAGTFTMGSPTTEINRGSDETQHEVTLSAFRMSKYEITNAQYATFLNAKDVGSDGLYSKGAYPSEVLIDVNNLDEIIYNGSKWIPKEGYENNPVYEVNWYGASEFATYVGGFLPTEAQWEYACRAGTVTPFNTGNCLTNFQASYNWAFPYSTCTNTVTNYPFKTTSVGSYPPNSFGLYDMHGNLWEWCSDWYDAYSTTAKINPTGALSGSERVIRGGNWRDDARYCRSAIRNSCPPDIDYYHIGFRVVFTSIDNQIPTVTTGTLTNLTSSSFSCTGNVTSDGGTPVTARGICWSSTGTPTISDSKIIEGSGTGSFSVDIKGLTPNTTYFVSAFATNSAGTSYGGEVWVTTNPSGNETVTDIDGNVYHTVTIGTQTWMVENLKTTRYRNGDFIGTTSPATKDIYPETTPKYQWPYNGDEGWAWTDFGRLYTWYAANDTRKIAPVGWHVPTNSEWTTLVNYLIAKGYNYDGTTSGNKIAKSLAAAHSWLPSTNKGAIGNDLIKNNSSGFTALPGGLRYGTGAFRDIAYSGTWWSTTAYGSSFAWSMTFGNGDEDTSQINYNDKSDGFSVRCVKD